MPKFRLILEPDWVSVPKDTRTWEFSAKNIKEAVDISQGQFINPRDVEVVHSRVEKFEQLDEKTKEWKTLLEDAEEHELESLRNVV